MTLPERSRRLLGRSFFSFHTDFKDSKVFYICNPTIVKLSLSKPYENETKSIQSACNYSQRNHKLVKLLSIHSICVPITTTIKSPNQIPSPQLTNSPTHQVPNSPLHNPPPTSNPPISLSPIPPTPPPQSPYILHTYSIHTPYKPNRD